MGSEFDPRQTCHFIRGDTKLQALGIERCCKFMLSYATVDMWVFAYRQRSVSVILSQLALTANASVVLMVKRLICTQVFSVQVGVEAPRRGSTVGSAFPWYGKGRGFDSLPRLQHGD